MPFWLTLPLRISFLCEIIEKIYGSAIEIKHSFLSEMDPAALSWPVLLEGQHSSSRFLNSMCLDLRMSLLSFHLQSVWWGFAGVCLLQVFALQSSLLQLHPPDHVRLAMVDFLSSMGKVFIPQEAQVNGIVALMKLPCLLIKRLLFKYTVKESNSLTTYRNARTVVLD